MRLKKDKIISVRINSEVNDMILKDDDCVQKIIDRFVEQHFNVQTNVKRIPKRKSKKYQLPRNKSLAC